VFKRFDPVAADCYFALLVGVVASITETLWDLCESFSTINQSSFLSLKLAFNVILVFLFYGLYKLRVKPNVIESSTQSRPIKDRLDELATLRDSKSITKKEYQDAREKIISELYEH